MRNRMIDPKKGKMKPDLTVKMEESLHGSQFRKDTNKQEESFRKIRQIQPKCILNNPEMNKIINGENRVKF